MVGGGLKLEINIPPRHISAKSKGGLIIEGGVSSSEYGMLNNTGKSVSLHMLACSQNLTFNTPLCVLTH